MTEKKRLLWIELIRVISMFMVIVLHICMKGGVLYSTKSGSASYFFAWLMESLCYGAVNCYAIITGYVHYAPREAAVYKYHRIITLWLQVFWYSAGITLLLAVFCPEYNVSVITGFFPLLNDNYWYFTAYFGMFFFIPFFNALIFNLDDKSMIQLIVFLFIIFSFIPFCFDTEDLFSINRGYSTLWLTVMYFAGAFLKRFGDRIKLKKTIWAAVFAVSGLIPCICSSVMDTALLGRIDDGTMIQDMGGYTYSYCSPFTIASAVSLFMLLKDTVIKGAAAKAVKLLAPVSFGVFLIHTHPAVFDNAVRDLFSPLAELPCPLMVMSVIASAAGAYIVLGAADYIRIAVFRLLKADKTAEKLLGGIITRVKSMKLK